MYRQGDVLIVPIASIPRSASERIQRDAGRLVLAYGEATGHAHAIMDRKSAMFRDPKLNELFMRVAGDYSGPLPATLVEDGSDWFLAQTALRDRPVKFSKQHARLLGAAIECGPFALLDHDEHNPFAIPNGAHRVKGQREYTPEAIRRVAD